MAITAGLVRAKIVPATTPTIYNNVIAAADTEESQALSTNTKKLMVRVRNGASLKIAFASGESGTNYISVPAGSNYCADGIEFNGTLYYQSPQSGVTVEILEWV